VTTMSAIFQQFPMYIPSTPARIAVRPLGSTPDRLVHGCVATQSSARLYLGKFIGRGTCHPASAC